MGRGCTYLDCGSDHVVRVEALLIGPLPLPPRTEGGAGLGQQAWLPRAVRVLLSGVNRRHVEAHPEFVGEARGPVAGASW